MQQAPRHAVIAGTGRAGTSFLVRFLDACGLQTGVSAGEWFGRARSGIEHRLTASASLPYVVKDPWLFGYCDHVDLDAVGIDALLLPMRDLMDAAESRVHQERLGRIDVDARSAGPTIQVAGSAPGGVLYSLDVVDQARILAVGFHKLLVWAVRNELPVFLLSFPRMIEDGEYLIDRLQPWLGEHCHLDAARAAFEKTADRAAVRIGRDAPPPGQGLLLGRGEPDLAKLEREAMVERLRELVDTEAENARLRRELAEAEHSATASDQRAAAFEAARDELARTLAEQERLTEGAREDAVHAAQSLDRAQEELSQIRATAVWQARQRLMGHRWAYAPARFALRTLMRARDRHR